MTRPLRLAINGASGRMGRALIALLDEDARFELVYAVVAPGSSLDGLPVVGASDGSLCHVHDWKAAPALDVVIDFSGPDALTAALDPLRLEL